MRHRKSKVTLDRKTGPRKALLKNLSEALVLYEKIRTTEAKAKATKPLVEKIINLGKKGDLASRRRLVQYLFTQNSIKKTIDVLGPRYKSRTGGYVRLVRIMPRQGAGANMIQME